MSNKNYVIAIDGPAGAGKSTIAKQLADVLNFTFVNSGGLYRCLAIALKNISLENTEDVEAIINSSKIIQEKNSFFLNDLDVTTECYSKEIAGLVPFIAKIPCVGKKIIDIRREIAKTASIVVEGRETTSVVFPDANLKVYLDASVQVRAQRRWEELNKVVPFDEVEKNVILRDKMDTERKINPLIRVPDAFYLLTDGFSVDEIINILIEEFNSIK